MSYGCFCSQANIFSVVTAPSVLGFRPKQYFYECQNQTEDLSYASPVLWLSPFICICYFLEATFSLLKKVESLPRFNFQPVFVLKPKNSGRLTPELCPLSIGLNAYY